MPHLRKTRQDLVDEITALTEQNYLLSTAAQERDLAIEEVQRLSGVVEQQRFTVNRLEAERDLARTELTRATVSQEELQRLHSRVASIMAICRVPNKKLGPYSKLAMITLPEQVPYSAETHGGSSDVMLTSMKKWNASIGGGDEEKNPKNTNCIARALEPFEGADGTGTITRTLVDLGDGRRHYTVECNQEHFRNPLLINPSEERKNNGGDKRCPACGGFCKKQFQFTYVCTNPSCAIDYDSDMNPVDHAPATPAPATKKEEHQEARGRVNDVLAQLELKPEPAPSFTDVPTKQAYAPDCKKWSAHSARWKPSLSGLHCPVCTPAFAI